MLCARLNDNIFLYYYNHEYSTYTYIRRYLSIILFYLDNVESVRRENCCLYYYLSFSIHFIFLFRQKHIFQYIYVAIAVNNSDNLFYIIFF